MMKNIEISEGIIASQIILTLLTHNSDLDEILELNKAVITVDAMQNLREQGYSYNVYNGENKKFFTWCTYIHRNSDDIIINGKEGSHSGTGELPYIGDKYEYIASFSNGDFTGAALKLAIEIKKFVEQE